MSLKPATARRCETPPPRARPVELQPPAQEPLDDEDAATKKQPLEKNNGTKHLGLHTQQFMAIVVVPAIFFILCAVAAGPGRTYSETVIKNAEKTWSAVSIPAAKLVDTRADVIVAIVALASMSPLFFVIAASTFRATLSLRPHAMWQQVSLGVFVLSAFGTAGIYNTQALRVMMMMKTTWESISDPLENILTTNADNVVAFFALFCLFPIVLVLASCASRAVWGGRVKIVVEPCARSDEGASEEEEGSIGVAMKMLLFAAAVVLLGYVAATRLTNADVISNASTADAFANSFAMIIVTELGDKTFFIAAILAMKKDRRFVFLGAAGALASMTVLSSCIGLTLPAILPPQYTNWAATGLFIYFGLKLLYEAYEMFSSGQGAGPSSELDEVEQTLKENQDSKSTSTAIEAFVLTFLAEWGDRSQIATIALAAARSPIGVTLGGVVGHSCCTGLAVLGGRVLATRISERAMVASGGLLFLLFGIHGVIGECMSAQNIVEGITQLSNITMMTISSIATSTTTTISNITTSTNASTTVLDDAVNVSKAVA